MASSSNASRKRSLAQATQGEDEATGMVQANGRRHRYPSHRQQQINEDQTVRLQARINRQKKALAKQRQKLAEFHDEEVNPDANDDDESGMESQDEEDMGRGARPGGGFTSVISSKGTVSHSRSVAQKKQLVLETNRIRDGFEPLHIRDVNRTRDSEPTGNGQDNSQDSDEDMAPRTPRLSSPRSPISPLSPSRSSPPAARVRHEHQTLPSASQIRRERTTPPPSPVRSSSQRTTPSLPRPEVSHIHASRRATPSLPHPEVNRIRGTSSTRRTTPSSPHPEVNRIRGTSSRRTTPSPHPEVNRDSLPPPHQRTRLLPAPFRQGYSPGSKPKAADYEDGVEKMLLKAMHEYACLILTADAFPNEMKQTQWAEATWHAACEEVGVHYECSVRMIRLITSRGSWARGFLKDAARNNFKIFKFKEGSTEEIKRYNQELRLSLLRDDVFHHKNQNDVTGFGEHRVVIDILRDALFEDNKSYGVKYSRYFNPISINLLALVFTMIEFLINEWSTGERKKTTFRSKTYSDTFDAHYLRTEQWCDLEPTVTTNIRKRMFRTLMKKAGALEQVDGRSGERTGMTASMKERAKEALVGRTGETDDEDD